MHIEQVDFVSIPTRDLAAAVTWHRDILELPASDTTAGELETRNLTLAFWEPEREGLPFVANEAGIAFRVPDVAASRAPKS